MTCEDENLTRGNLMSLKEQISALETNGRKLNERQETSVCYQKASSN